MKHPLLLKNTLERGVRLSPETTHVWNEPARKEVGLEPIYRCTYKDLYRRVRQVANMVNGLGVKAGDWVGILSDNSHRATEIDFAIPMMGAACHFMYPTQPVEQVSYLAKKGQYKVLFIDEKYISMAEKVAKELTIQGYIIMSDRQDLPQTSLSPVYSYEKLINEVSSEYIFPENLDENQVAVILNTGGSTGMPKLMTHSHRSVMLHTLDICMPADAWGIRGDDTILLAMPVWYANHYNVHYAAALAGAKMVFPNSLPEGKELGELIEREGVTFTYGTGSHFASWVSDWERENWKYDLTSLDRVANNLSSIASPSVCKTLHEKTGAKIFSGMGFTEGCPITSVGICRSEDWEEIEKVITKDGKRTFLIDIKVVATIGGKEVKPDGKEIGFIGYKGPHIIEEYYDEPKKTAESFDDEGFFYSGDVGTIDADGNTLVRGRKEDMINTREGLIPPKYFEDIVMNQFSLVTECAAVGIPSGEYEKPVIAVVLRESYKGKENEESIRKAFEGKIPESIIPEVRIFESLPRQAAGKLSRLELKKMLS